MINKQNQRTRFESERMATKDCKKKQTTNESKGIQNTQEEAKAMKRKAKEHKYLEAIRGKILINLPSDVLSHSDLLQNKHRLRCDVAPTASLFTHAVAT